MPASSGLQHVVKSWLTASFLSNDSNGQGVRGIMAADQAPALAPVTGKARIDVLDILRGLAILAIFFMNIPTQAASVMRQFADIRYIGWTLADQRAWTFVEIFLEGTQRCLLEFLFGAGMMVLTARAMQPDGPVAIADLYLRRTLWLALFGLFDIFVVLWVGDILFIYSLAALLLFPFRTLKPRTLVLLGSIYLIFTVLFGTVQYIGRTQLVHDVATAHQHQAAHQPLTKADQTALADWQKRLNRLSLKPDDDLKKHIAEEEAGHKNGYIGYAQFAWTSWVTFLWGKGGVPLNVFEAFCTMLIGIALWKWGVIQGQRRSRFYLALMIVAYAIGLGTRSIGALEVMTFAPYPKTIWITQEIGRLSTALGHLALINWAVRTRLGWAILAPFRAAGRMAFSLYFLEQIIGLHILFSPYGFNLWGRWSWAGFETVALVIVAVLLVVANIWVRFFAIGPMEWCWRSLAYLKRQPFRRRPATGLPA